MSTIIVALLALALLLLVELAKVATSTTGTSTVRRVQHTFTVLYLLDYCTVVVLTGLVQKRSTCTMYCTCTTVQVQVL
jgi:hypothetical protein